MQEFDLYGESIDTLIPGTNNQILTEFELEAFREEFAVNSVSYDIHDLILADISPEMLHALRQADSITIIAKHGQQELHFQLYLANDDHQNNLQGPRQPISII